MYVCLGNNEMTAKNSGRKISFFTLVSLITATFLVFAYRRSSVKSRIYEHYELAATEITKMKAIIPTTTASVLLNMTTTKKNEESFTENTKGFISPTQRNLIKNDELLALRKLLVHNLPGTTPSVDATIKEETTAIMVNNKTSQVFDQQNKIESTKNRPSKDETKGLFYWRKQGKHIYEYASEKNKKLNEIMKEVDQTIGKKQENQKSKENLKKDENSPPPVQYIFERNFGKEDIKKRFEHRKQILVKNCQPSVKQGLQSWRNMIGSPKHKINVCFIPKAGSQKWQEIIYKLRHDKYAQVPLTQVRSLNSRDTRFLDARARERIKTDPSYKRILLVRHPFSRLISAWHDKLLRNGPYEVHRNLPGLEEYIGKHEYYDKKHLISFKGLVRYLLTKDMADLDVHFQSVEMQCWPCRFPYNYIIKIETSVQDSAYILDELGGNGVQMDMYHLHDPSTGHVLNVSPSSFEDQHLLLQEQARVMQHNVWNFFRSLDRGDAGKLFERYKSDFELFGYTYDPDTHAVGGFY